MQPFDEKIPEEGQQENEALIAFLRRAYRRTDADGVEGREQALLRVRERLLCYEARERPPLLISPLSPVAGEVGNMRSARNRFSYSPGRNGKNSLWARGARGIIAVAVVLLLVSSTLVLFQALRQSKSGSGGTNLPVLAEFKGTGSKTFSHLNLAVPRGRGVHIDLSCDGPGKSSVALYNAYPLLGDSGDDDWHHPKLFEFGFGSCSDLKSELNGVEMGVGEGTYTLTYTVYEVQIKIDPATSWKLKIVSYPVSPPPDLHLPVLALPGGQVSLGEFAGTGGKILVPSAYSLPPDFHPDRPWQLHLICRGQGNVYVTLDMHAYQLSEKYKNRIPALVTYTVPCGAATPASVSQLFPALNNASRTVVIDITEDKNVNWHWVLGMCMDGSTPGCQSPLEKP
ncbi:hypothetical protein EPA93_28180 [Ktedonosporobacter rubrisoli]|uniref:Uncharacterized protein n=1 Tax=Ktedonosporobacter rubrisoli TaxID=2509675 RepID=A0A4P6JW07_KTERU|nr:hypothetical protein [Ktedonosporobacter rubrisoli]QBD79645.1 hypothetical protein EPA93_28180 [Ktedonosporobacter rubrisoli]